MKIILLLAFLSPFLHDVCGIDARQGNLSKTDKFGKVFLGRNSDTSWEEDYVGCFEDGGHRDLPHHSKWSGSMTIPYCIDHCRARKKPYCGLQAGGECFCSGPNWRPSKARYGRKRDAECNHACTGNHGYDCGGGWRNSVYKVKIGKEVKRYEIQKLTFREQDVANQIAKTPDVMATTTVKNENNEEISTSRTLSISYALTTEWEMSHSLTAGVEVTLTAGTDAVVASVETSFGFSLSAGYTNTAGESTTTQKTYETTVSITVPPRKQCTVITMASQYTSEIHYAAQLVTIYKNSKNRPRFQDITGKLRGVSKGDFRTEQARCIDICPPALEDNCDETKACVVDEDCDSNENCKCSDECGMICKIKKPAHPCARTPPICERDGICIRVPTADEDDSRYESLEDQTERERLQREENVIIDIEYVEPLEDDPEYKCQCLDQFGGKHCNEMAGHADGILCKHGWDVDAGVLGKESWVREDRCLPSETCIRLEGHLDTPGPFRHYHKVYRCYDKYRCQETVDDNCMRIALDTINSGHNIILQAASCKAACCDEDNCNSKPLVALRPDLFQPIPVYSTQSPHVATTRDPPTLATCRSRKKRDVDSAEDDFDKEDQEQNTSTENI